jgi:N-Acetylglucosaminyltransferase-IV (GnT-IV) conserved region
MILVEMVLGVPTVKREMQSYLLTTLLNLVQNLDAVEQSKTLIIVFVAETDLGYVESVAKEIEMQLNSLKFALLIEPCGLNSFFSQVFHSRGSRTDRGNLPSAVLLPRLHNSDTEPG